MKDTTQKPKDLKFAILATDVVLFTLEDDVLKVLLIDVDLPPYYVNGYALPGGLILPNETADDSVNRHLQNKVGITNAPVEQLYTFSGVQRDPRGRVVSVAYMGLISPEAFALQEKKSSIYWKNARAVSKLAYDHNEIVKKALLRLEAKVGYSTIVRGLLSKEFTLSELQKAYEIILQTKFDKRNFRKKILAINVLKSTGNQKKGEANRPADLYMFASDKDHIVDII